jgi:PST family polysaccharide transporter
VSLADRSFSALKWNYLGAFAQMGSQFVIGLVLARLLGPEPFGLVAVAWLVLGLCGLIADFGLGIALIQRKEISPQEIRYVFTLQCLVGSGFTAVVWALSGWIALFFRRPDAAPVMQAMSLIFLFQAFGHTATALLRRDLNFRLTEIIRFCTYLIGYLAFGLPLALHGAGVWSLVAAQLSQSALYSLSVYAAVRHPSLPSFHNRGGALITFGAKVTGGHLTSWGIGCLDGVVVGRAFGVVELGLYNRAFVLVNTPMSAIVTSVQNVLFSTGSRAQDDKPALWRTYLAALGAMGFVCVPMFFAAAAAPATVVAGVYGAGWAAAAPLLTPLSIAMPFYALMALGGPIMLGMGQAGKHTGVQLISLVGLALALWWASGHTIEAVAWSVTGTYVLRFLLVTHVTLNMVEGRWIEVTDVLRGPLLLGLLTALATFSADAGLGYVSISNELRLALVVSAGSGTAIIGFVLLRRLLCTAPMIWLLANLCPRLPQPLRRFVEL